MRRLAFLCVALASLTLGGCKAELLPGSAVEDNSDNRAVVDFVEEYRKAIEARSSDRVLTLVADDYWEDGGTPDQEDDYGVEKLQASLEKSFDHANAIYLELFVQSVVFDEEKGVWNVDYRYRERALLSFDAGEKWVTHTDVNRIVLRARADDREHTDDGFLIVSGL